VKKEVDGGQGVREVVREGDGEEEGWRKQDEERR
jgi:hypothetical protein